MRPYLCISIKLLIMMERKKRIIRDTSQSRPVSGSKPRVFATNTRTSNPSLISQSVTALFLGDPRFNPESKWSHLQQRQNSYMVPTNLTAQSIYNNDSLKQAEQEFALKKKDSNKPPEALASERTGLGPRRNSTPVLMSLPRMSFASDSIIKERQSHGYNIINCRPSN